MTNSNPTPALLIFSSILYTLIGIGGFMGPYSGVGALFFVNSLVLVICLVLIRRARMSPMTASLLAVAMQMVICLAAIYGTRIDFEDWYKARGVGEVIAILGGPVVVFAALAIYYHVRPQFILKRSATSGRTFVIMFSAGFFLFANWEQLGKPGGRIFLLLAIAAGLFMGYVIYPMIEKSSSVSRKNR